MSKTKLTQKDITDFHDSFKKVEHHIPESYRHRIWFSIKALYRKLFAQEEG
jgi:hypothetical protein